MREILQHIEEAGIFKPAPGSEVAKRRAARKAAAEAESKRTGKFMCPHCLELLDYVNVYFEAFQPGKLEGTKIVDYGVEELVDGTTDIECSNCGENIREFIEE